MKAAIDIGTNTTLLLIAEVENGVLNVIHEEQRMPRLGKGVDAGGAINKASRDRVVNALKEYKVIIDAEYPETEEVIVTATSAVRDASNREEFLGFVKKETGFDVQLLSGKEEADCTFLGAVSVFGDSFSSDVFVLDIGGGSTELALGRKGVLTASRSFDMGCVRFTERYLKHDPPFTEEIRQCREQVKYQLSSFKFRPKRNVRAIGVAGTMTSLAAIDLQLESYDSGKLNGHTIQRDKLSKSIELFSLHTHKQLLELSPVVMKGREDIFLAGLLILEEFLNFYRIDEIIVSTGGIRHGTLLNHENLKI